MAYKNDNVDMEMVRVLVDDYADCGEITEDSIIEYMIDYQMYSLNEDYICDYNDYLMRCGQNTYCEMEQLDYEFSNYTPSEIIDALDRDFDINDEYYYIDMYDAICSCDSDYIIDAMEQERDFLTELIYDCFLDDFNNTYHEEIDMANEILEREEEEDEDWAY